MKKREFYFKKKTPHEQVSMTRKCHNHRSNHCTLKIFKYSKNMANPDNSVRGGTEHFFSHQRISQKAIRTSLEKQSMDPIASRGVSFLWKPINTCDLPKTLSLPLDPPMQTTKAHKNTILVTSRSQLFGLISYTIEAPPKGVYLFPCSPEMLFEFYDKPGFNYLAVKNKFLLLN